MRTSLILASCVVLLSLQLLPDFDGQAFPREHVQNRQSSKPPPIGQLVGYKIQAPHLVGSRRPESLVAMQRGSPLSSWLVPQRCRSLSRSRAHRHSDTQLDSVARLLDRVLWCWIHRASLDGASRSNAFKTRPGLTVASSLYEEIPLLFRIHSACNLQDHDAARRFPSTVVWGCRFGRRRVAKGTA